MIAVPPRRILRPMLLQLGVVALALVLLVAYVLVRVGVSGVARSLSGA